MNVSTFRVLKTLLPEVLMHCVESENIQGLQEGQQNQSGTILYLHVNSPMILIMILTAVLKVFLYWWETNTREICAHFQSELLRAKENNEAMIRFS